MSLTLQSGLKFQSCGSLPHLQMCQEIHSCAKNNTLVSTSVNHNVANMTHMKAMCWHLVVGNVNTPRFDMLHCRDSPDAQRNTEHWMTPRRSPTCTAVSYAWVGARVVILNITTRRQRILKPKHHAFWA